MIEDVVKPDTYLFHQVLDNLKQQWWLGSRSWWPNYAFHFTDVKNVASILNHGFIFSRTEAIRNNLIIEDSASSQIIRHTEDELTNYVRFYFRPLTPTAYNNEGFRPLCMLYHDAHCPVPIYLLFDLKKLISLKDTRFSDGNLARSDRVIQKTAAEFAGLPFQDIYHNSGWGNELLDRQDQIKNRRHAEIVYPGRISLGHMTRIVCRSLAEYQTLQNLLSPLLWNRWKHRVAVSTRRQLFYCEWLYVKDVALHAHSLEIGFSYPANPPFYGPFEIRVDIIDNLSGKTGFFEKVYQDMVVELPSAKLNLDLSNLDTNNYTVRVSVAGILAFLGKYTGDDIPF